MPVSIPGRRPARLRHPRVLAALVLAPLLLALAFPGEALAVGPNNVP